MPSPDIEVLARQARRRALAVVIRAHPEWTLAQVLASELEHAELIGELTVLELCGHRPRYPGQEHPSQTTRYERAYRAHGEAFAELVYEVMVEAGEPVQTRYLRARLGGPRWKVKGALERLCEQGRVVREGVTSDTFYLLSVPARRSEPERS